MPRPTAAKKKKQAKVVKKSKEKEVEEPKKKIGKFDKKRKKDEKKRGRPVGVKYVVPEEYQDKILENYDSLEEELKELRLAVRKFVDYANKSSVKVARGHAMNITKICKELRSDLQEAKENLEQE